MSVKVENTENKNEVKYKSKSQPKRPIKILSIQTFQF